MLAGLERHQRRDCCGYEKRQPWCWPEEAAPCILQEQGLVALHIAGIVWGISVCWFWQCLLTFDGNLLSHSVTILDVTTAAWCCRQTQDVLHPTECPRGALQTSEWQWTASVFTTWYCTGSVGSLFTVELCLQNYMHLRYGCCKSYKKKVSYTDHYFK